MFYAAFCFNELDSDVICTSKSYSKTLTTRFIKINSKITSNKTAERSMDSHTFYDKNSINNVNRLRHIALATNGLA